FHLWQSGPARFADDGADGAGETGARSCFERCEERPLDVRWNLGPLWASFQPFDLGEESAGSLLVKFTVDFAIRRVDGAAGVADFVRLVIKLLAGGEILQAQRYVSNVRRRPPGLEGRPHLAEHAPCRLDRGDHCI